MTNLVRSNHRLPATVLDFPSRDDVFYPFQQFFDQIFNEFFSESGKNSVKSRQGYPRWDVYETDKEYVVEVCVNGMRPEDAKVEILPAKETEYTGEGRQLRISGRMSESHQTDADAKFLVRELRRSSFERSMTLPNYVKGDPTASMRDGLLRLSWKLEKERPDNGTKVIPINVE